jgi:hypothetical protein
VFSDDEKIIVATRGVNPFSVSANRDAKLHLDCARINEQDLSVFPKDPMAEYSIQLRGWHALLAIVAKVAFTGIKMYLRIRPVEDGMRDAIRVELLNEFSGRGP